MVGVEVGLRDAARDNCDSTPLSFTDVLVLAAFRDHVVESRRSGLVIADAKPNNFDDCSSFSSVVRACASHPLGTNRYGESPKVEGSTPSMNIPFWQWHRALCSG